MNNIKLVTAAVILSAASINAQNVTINMRNKNADTVFSELMRQTGKNFIYSSGILEGLKVDLNATDTPLTEALDRMFRGTGISYKIKGNNVLLSRRKVKVVTKHTVSGFVREEGSGEALVGASVFEEISGKGAVTNANGFYSLTLPENNARLKIQYVGLDPEITETFSLNGNKAINFNLSAPHELEEIVVTASVNNSKAMNSAEIGSLNLTNSAIKATPVIFGESDVVKTLQLEPGVSAGIEGMAGMYVHGGDTDENMYMLDNIPLYQVNHFGGLFSAFNVEAIRNADFYKSSFPAKYDGRLSSFLDVHTKDGSLSHHSGSFRLGLTSGAFAINGPIWKGHTSYSVAVRRSWFDLLTIPALAIANKISKSQNTHFRYAFTDVNAKINHRFSDRSSAYLMFYYGEDFLSAGTDDKGKNDFDIFPDYSQPYASQLNNLTHDISPSDETPESTSYSDTHARLIWGNIVASAGWRYTFTPKLFGEVTGAFSRYYSSLKSVNEDGFMSNGETTDYIRDTYRHHNNINDWTLKADFNWIPAPDNKVDFGASFTTHSFLPSRGVHSLKDGETTTSAYDNVPTYSAGEWNFYISDDIRLLDIVRVNAGLHYSIFNIENKSHSALSPRFSVNVSPTRNFAMKAGYSRAVQYVVQLAQSNISLPTDQWVPITGDQKPQTSDKISVGFYMTTPDRMFTLSVEGYYKWMRNLLDYADDYYLVPPSESWTSKIEGGKGRAKGIDIKLSKESGKFTGHLSYSLLWADRCFPSVNNGEWFPARFDNRHKINVALNWKINTKWELGATWTGMSGNRITLPLQCWNDPSLGPWHFDMTLYEKRNNFRLPFYHRLDLSATRKTKNGFWTFSLYNAYSFMNVIAVRKDVSLKDYTHDADGHYIPKDVFQYIRAIPVIPSVSYTWLF